jgi:hypothetical protein
MQKQCEICGKQFEVKPSHFEKRKTCGLECGGKLRSKQRLGKPQPHRRKKCIRCKTNLRRGRHKLLCDSCYSELSSGSKLVSLTCLGCGEPFQRTKRDVDRGRTKYCSHGCYRRSVSRDKNPNWKGGKKAISSRIRASLKMKEWIAAVLENDGYKCFYCGKTGRLEAHHIVKFSEVLNAYKFYNESLDFDGLMEFQPLWDVNNGVALCHVCHSKFPRFLPEGTIYVPEEFRDRLLTNAIKIQASSVDEVVEKLGLGVKLAPLFA